MTPRPGIGHGGVDLRAGSRKSDLDQMPQAGQDRGSNALSSAPLRSGPLHGKSARDVVALLPRIIEWVGAATIQ